MDKIIYMRIPEGLHKRLEAILKMEPAKKSTMARFLLEKGIEEYERRLNEGRLDWFPTEKDVVAA